MTSTPASPRSAGGLGALTTAARIYLTNANSLLLIVAIFLVPTTILFVTLLHATIPEELLSVDPATTENPFGDLTFGEITTFGLAVLAGAIVNFVLSMVAIGACFRIVHEALTGSAPAWRASVQAAMQKVGALVWIPILMSLAFIAGGIVVILVLVLLSAIAESIAALPVMVGITAAVYFFVRWSLAIPVVMAEDVRGMAALARSAALIRGQWWSTFGVYAMAFLVMVVVSAVIGAIFDNPTEVTGDQLVLATLGSIITNVLVIPYQAALLGVVFLNLRGPQTSEALDDEVDGAG